MERWNAGDIAIVTGDDAGEAHEFPSGVKVRLVEAHGGRVHEDLWRCVAVNIPAGEYEEDWDWWVNVVDLELVSIRATEVEKALDSIKGRSVDVIRCKFCGKGPLVPMPIPQRHAGKWLLTEGLADAWNDVVCDGRPNSVGTHEPEDLTHQEVMGVMESIKDSARRITGDA